MLDLDMGRKDSREHSADNRAAAGPREEILAEDPQRGDGAAAALR
jgi:hypothetical protein